MFTVFNAVFVYLCKIDDVNCMYSTLISKMIGPAIDLKAMGKSAQILFVKPGSCR